MRLVFFSIGYIIFGSWMNLVINNYFQIVDLKINWVLIFTLVLAFRYSRIFVPFIGIIAGGDKALRNSIEGAEDLVQNAIIDLKPYTINKMDTVIGIKVIHIS